MTRILHTADLHLAEDRPERWAALEAIREVADAREVDAVVVAGDLLDRAGDHAALRERVRGALDAFPCDVFVSPGNHDREAYRPGQDWGRRTRLMLSEPVCVDRLDEVTLVAVPFPADPTSFARTRRHVAERSAEAEGAVVLLLHGTLVDAADPHIQAEAREDEPEDPYFPVRTGELRGLGVAYVALGHYHQPDLRRVDGLPVAYPGSPSPVGSHAWGPRSVVLVDLGDGAVAVEPVGLPVPFRRRLVRWLTPFEEATDLEALEAELEELADPDCSLRVELEGILAGIDEAELRARVEALEADWRDRYDALEVRPGGVGLDPGRADLFRDFRRRLERRLEGAERGEPGETAGESAGGPGIDLGRPGLRQRTLEIAARALKG